MWKAKSSRCTKLKSTEISEEEMSQKRCHKGQSEGWKRNFPFQEFSLPGRVQSLQGLWEWDPRFPHRTSPSLTPCPSRVSPLNWQIPSQTSPELFPSSQLRDVEFPLTNSPGIPDWHCSKFSQIWAWTLKVVTPKISSPGGSKLNKFQDSHPCARGTSVSYGVGRYPLI